MQWEGLAEMLQMSFRLHRNSNCRLVGIGTAVLEVFDEEEKERLLLMSCQVFSKFAIKLKHFEAFDLIVGPN